MKNRERLTEAKILTDDAPLSSEQEEAIENLTTEEIDVLITVKDKVADVFPPETLIAPITHHH
jgi:hypothetical protein